MLKKRHLVLHTTASVADVAALRAMAKNQSMTPAEYLRFLAQFSESVEQLRQRRGPSGEPFTLE